jgi:hypothetical protein
MKLEFYGQIFEKAYIKFYKSRPLGAKLIHANGRKDGRTDVTKLIVALRNFANAPKSEAG